MIKKLLELNDKSDILTGFLFFLLIVDTLFLIYLLPVSNYKGSGIEYSVLYMLFVFGVILPMILTSSCDPKYVRYKAHKRVLVLDVIFLIAFCGGVVIFNYRGYLKDGIFSFI